LLKDRSNVLDDDLSWTLNKKITEKPLQGFACNALFHVNNMEFNKYFLKRWTENFFLMGCLKFSLLMLKNNWKALYKGLSFQVMTIRQFMKFHISVSRFSVNEFSLKGMKIVANVNKLNLQMQFLKLCGSHQIPTTDNFFNFAPTTLCAMKYSIEVWIVFLTLFSFCWRCCFWPTFWCQRLDQTRLLINFETRTASTKE